MIRNHLDFCGLALLAGALVTACSGDDSGSTTAENTGGSAGAAAGSAGSAGTTASAGSLSSAGSSGNAPGAGAGGSAGSSSAGAAGSAGVGNNADTAGHAGAAGSADAAGSAGLGTAGTPASAGSSNAGAAGSAGSGSPYTPTDLAVFIGNIDDGENGVRMADFSRGRATEQLAGGAGGAGGTMSVLAVAAVDHSDILIDTQLDAVAFSPDGARYAIAGRMAGTGSFAIYEFRTDGSTAPTKIIDSDARGVVSMKYSPDGANLAFITGNGSGDLFIGSADASDTAYQEVATGYVTSYSWMPDASAIVYVEASSATAPTGALMLGPLADLTSPVELRASRTAHHVEVASDGTIYHIYDPAPAAEEARLYSISADGSDPTLIDFDIVVDAEGNDLPVPQDGPRVNNFALSPDSRLVAVSLDVVTADNFQLFVKDLVDSTNAVMVSDVRSADVPDGSAQWGPAEDSLLVWAPDSGSLVVGADWPVDAADEDNAQALWLVNTTGAPGGIRLLGSPSDALLDAERATWSRTGDWIFVYGDLEDQDTYAVYALDDFATTDQDPATVRIGDLPVTSVADLAVMP